MLAYFPWVGLVVGALAAATFWFFAALFGSPALAALLALVAGLITTGAFHEDGLADTVDGFGGGYDTIRILAIMKDSRIGAFGAIALWVALTAQWQALTLIAEKGSTTAVMASLLAIHPLARFSVLVPMTRLSYLRLAEAQGKAYPFAKARLTRAEWIKAAVALAPLLLLTSGAALAASLGALLGAAYWWWRGKKRLGGYTGDLLGAITATAFTTGLLGIVAAWNSI